MKIRRASVPVLAIAFALMAFAALPLTNDAQARRARAPKSHGEHRTLAGKVVRVSDGDTVVVLKDRDQTKIRLLGIDAPEKSMPFGQVCSKKLADLVAGRDVTVEIVDTDQYGRSLGKVLLAGHDMNLAQIEAGCAWHYKHYEKAQVPADRALYAQAEIAARRARRGLWADAKPVAPWDFRREGKSAHQSKRR